LGRGCRGSKELATGPCIGRWRGWGGRIGQEERKRTGGIPRSGPLEVEGNSEGQMGGRGEPKKQPNRRRKLGGLLFAGGEASMS